ncbi:biotin/lipoate--protein ligase family protein [Palleronia caenipelagi]|uniref:DUF4444 domain-containing protein n=1 Tax=Palleronia caenipelagi TaxID=2489174 RepID=A0A547Q9I7_9RHOB|nr:biotin/lipoate--protein ligase family protein [Palleronia caenipelagi]TRD23010.1 DUF4444 domain-containing protein [Palleronia caenipelagi]
MIPLGPLDLPPLLWSEAAEASARGHALARAAEGCEAGMVTACSDGDLLEAALVLAPEVPLAEAAAMLPLCAVGLQNALGALAPPEVAVHLDWSGAVRLNGGICGGLNLTASTADPNVEPDWLVVGLHLDLRPQTDAPGLTPERTTLWAEGCGDIAPADLVSAWARHTLWWITRWEDPEGARALHTEWAGLTHGSGDPLSVSGQTGTYLGVDERFGLLLKQGPDTRLIPLTDLLEDAP